TVSTFCIHLSHDLHCLAGAFGLELLRKRYAMKLFYRILAGLLLCVGLNTFIQWRFFNHALDSQQRRASRLTAQVLGHVLEHAHRTNDDLTQQVVLEGLTESSGSVFSSVKDLRGRILVVFSQPRRRWAIQQAGQLALMTLLGLGW